jgi:hypothetical protein
MHATSNPVVPQTHKLLGQLLFQPLGIVARILNAIDRVANDCTTVSNVNDCIVFSYFVLYLTALPTVWRRWQQATLLQPNYRFEFSSSLLDVVDTADELTPDAVAQEDEISIHYDLCTI